MEETEIKALSRTRNMNVVISVLYSFIDENKNVFSFPNLDANNRELLWTAIFQHLQYKKFFSVRPHCLLSLRLLSRDKTDIDKILSTRWVTALIEIAGLNKFDSQDEKYLEPMDGVETTEAEEALKCLCNLTFNSEVARALCVHASIAKGLIARLRRYSDVKTQPGNQKPIMLYDMRLLFILTALRQDIKTKIKDEHGMEYLINFLDNILSESTNTNVEDQASSSSGNKKGANQCFLSDHYHAIICEILKTQFNLIQQSGPEEPVDENEEAMFLKLMPVLTGLLCAHTTSEEKLLELGSNVTNLLTSVPTLFYPFLTPDLSVGESAQYSFDEKNMDAFQSLMAMLQYRLDITTGTNDQYESLLPILTVLIKSAHGCRAQRRYLRQAVLPPLRDVLRRPELGHTLRNQMCRLLTTPVSSVRDLVAEFLFILCKENVGRMVKYTGFGNAAGHLAQKGLLCGGRSGDYSSSDDSDTEEYREAQDNIDPVVGCIRPPRANPFEGMTDEQKEFEAMKLVNLFDKMLSDGVMKPARIGPDGRPQAVEHVLELRENPPKNPQS